MSTKKTTKDEVVSALVSLHKKLDSLQEKVDKLCEKTDDCFPLNHAPRKATKKK